jgi:hypothetical protein
MTRIEEIYEFVLGEMKDHDIEDTTENRIAFLQGMYEAWEEDSDISIEKTFYQMALHSEITMLKLKKTFSRIMK